MSMSKKFLANTINRLSLYPDEDSKKAPMWNFGQRDSEGFLIPTFGYTQKPSASTPQIKPDYPVPPDYPVEENPFSPLGISSSILSGISDGLDGRGGSFRITNGQANGSHYSPKFYPSEWQGGSAARITTYKLSDLGKYSKFAGWIETIANGLWEIIQAINNGEDPWKVGAKILGGIGLGMLASYAVSGLLAYTGAGIPAAIAIQIVASLIASYLGEKAGEEIYEKNIQDK